MKNLWQVWLAEHIVPLANTNLHLLQGGAFSSNAFSCFYGWGAGQYNGPTWNVHIYRYRGKKKVEKICTCVLQKSGFGCLSFLYNVKSSFQCFWKLCILFIVMAVVGSPLFAREKLLQVQWEVNVSMSSARLGPGWEVRFWPPCIVPLFICWCANVCLTWITFEVFLPTHVKSMCNWASGLHVRACPSSVNAETETESESSPIFLLLPHPTTTTSFPKQCFLQVQHTSWFQ